MTTGRARERADPLHAHLLVVAQPGRELVQPDPARRARPRRLQQRQRPRREAHALHPSVQQKPKTDQVEVRQPEQANQVQFIWFSGLATAADP